MYFNMLSTFFVLKNSAWRYDKGQIKKDDARWRIPETCSGQAWAAITKENR
jgi:hypothetical protein